MDNASLKKILQNLTSELDYQKELLKLLAIERNEIVKLRATELDKLRFEKEEILLKISNNKDKRDNILSAFNPTTEQKELPTLKTLFENSPKELKLEFDKISPELKNTVISIQKLNKDNSGLLRQSLGLVSSTISILTARPTVDNTNYKKDGKVTDDQENLTAPGSISSFNRAV